MIPGSAAENWFVEWLHGVRRALIVGGEHPPYAVPPVAYDGLTGKEGVLSLPVSVSFAGSTVTRFGGGSFVDDGWRPGMLAQIVSSVSNSGMKSYVASVTASALTFTGNVVFVSEGPTNGVRISGSVVDGFALYVGPQHLQRWTGANVCTIVPSLGAPGNGLMSRRTETIRRALGSCDLAVDVHVWGEEPGENVSQRDGFWDIERYRAPSQILQNVLRVMFQFAKGYQALSAVDGWNNDTEQLRHGEMFGLTFTVSFPIFDFPDTRLPDDLRLTGNGQPTIKAPGVP